MASSLPMFVVLQSKNNAMYLEYVVKEDDPAHGFVRFSGESAYSPLSKFQVERAHSDGSKLVHLRCCYNNKYLVSSTRIPTWLALEADKPEEDHAKSSCTLFQPIPYGSDGYYRFKHVNSGKYAIQTWQGDKEPKTNCLFANWEDPDEFLRDVFAVIDWKTLVVLPRYVAFKGDNGNYLCAAGYHYLQFSTSDSGDSTAAHEVFPTSRGYIRIKSTYFGQFWRRGSSNWILADSDDTSTNDRETLFWPVKMDDNTIALRSLGNEAYCKRLTEDGMTSCLNASSPTICLFARLQVAELVQSRDIFNVQFHLTRARRHNEYITVMGSGSASNTTDEKNSMDVKVVRTETDSNSWNASVSLKLGVKTSLETQVPFIVDGKIEVSAELTSGFQWGEVHTKTHTIETVYKALVPSMTKVTVFAKVSTATCDIPYSYTVTDTMMDGKQRTYDMEDGIYIGMNSFNVSYEIKQEPIHV